MILTRYLYREIIQVALALLNILIVIYLSSRFIRFLVQATSGEVPGEFILRLLALKLLMVLGILLPLTFFLAVLITLGRMYVDQEMSVMAACGVGTPFVLQRVFVLALALALLTGGVTLVTTPWAEGRYAVMKEEIKRIAHVAGIVAGRFQEFNHGRGFFFIESMDDKSGVMHNVFVAYHRSDNRQVLLAAEQGGIEFHPEHGARYMVMRNGHRYEGIPGEAAMTLTRFERHSVRIDQEIHATQRENLKAMDVLTLWQSPRPEAQAELQMRLAAPLSILLLLPLAVLFSHTTPRQGRYARLFSAILLYFTYVNLLKVAQESVARGQLPAYLGLWWVHGIILIVFGIMLWRRRRV